MPPALQSFIAENPIVVAVVALVVVVFVVALVGGIVSGLRGRRRRAAIRREPRLYGVGDGDDDMPAYADAPAEAGTAMAARAESAAGPRPARRGFGLAALTLAFCLGVVAGVAAMLTSRAEIANGLARLSALVAGDATAPAGAAPAVAPALAEDGAAEPPSAGPAPVAEPPAADIAPRLAAFAASLEESLPRQAGPDLSLQRVSLDGTTLNLDYGVARVLPPDEVPAFQAYIDRTVRSLFCAEEAREIRYLSRNGVVFHMTYADSSGARVSELSVTPAYCG